MVLSADCRGPGLLLSWLCHRKVAHGQKGLLLSRLCHGKVVLLLSILRFHVALGITSGVAAPAEGPSAVAVPRGANADSLGLLGLLGRIVDVGPRLHPSLAIGGVRAGCETAHIIQALAIAIPLMVLSADCRGPGLLLSWLCHRKVAHGQKGLLLNRLCHGKVVPH